MKVIQHVLSPMKFFFIVPTKSVCTSSNGALFHVELPYLKGTLCFLPKIKSLHLLLDYTMHLKPSSILFLDNKLKPSWPRCPYLRCHGLKGSSIMLLKVNQFYTIINDFLGGATADWEEKHVSILNGNIQFFVIWTTTTNFLVLSFS